jgi:hypothetical protein
MKRQIAFVVVSMVRAMQLLSFFADDVLRAGFEISVFCPDDVNEKLKDLFREKNIKRYLLPRVPQRSVIAVLNHLRYFTLLSNENEFQGRLRKMDFKTSGFLLPYVLWPLSRILRFIPYFKKASCWDGLEKFFFGGGSYFREIFFKQHFEWVVFPAPVLRAMSELQMFISAKKAGFKVAAADEAWGQFAVLPVAFRTFDKVFVWNNYSIEQAGHFHRLPPKMFAVEGPLRFDSYFKGATPPREDFFAAHGFDPTKKIIACVLSGVDIEFVIIDRLIERLKKDMKGMFQIVIRTNPSLSKVDEYAARYRGIPDVIVTDPHEDITYKGFTALQSRVVDLGALLKFSSVVISHASTVAVEAAIFDTPVLYHLFGLDYVEESVPQGRVLRQQEAQRRYKYDEWASSAEVINTGAVPLARSMEELIALLDDALTNPQRLAQKRQELVKKICTYSDGRTGERIAQYLLSNAA